mgnify:FL=1
MISEFFLNIIFKFLSGMLNLLPDVSWSVDTTAFSYFLDIVRIVGYLVPAQTVYAIITLIVAFTVFRIIISLIKTIWDLLPFA